MFQLSSEPSPSANLWDVLWPALEKEILRRFLAPGGRVYTREESVAWANKILDVPEGLFRGYLPDGLALVFHEEGPWKGFPEAIHKWGAQAWSPEDRTRSSIVRLRGAQWTRIRAQGGGGLAGGTG